MTESVCSYILLLYHPFQDRYADAQAVPPIDDSQDWFLLEGEGDSGYTSLTFTRKWVTCDDRDRDIAVSMHTWVVSLTNR